MMASGQMYGAEDYYDEEDDRQVQAYGQMIDDEDASSNDAPARAGN